MAKRTRKNLARNVPLSIDPRLLADVDAVAGDRDETRSLVMRKAIEVGLPIVKAGGNADVLTLDSAFSAELEEARKETGQSRNKILIEAIRAGFQAYVSKVMSEKMSLAGKQNPKEVESLRRTIEEYYKMYSDPMALEHRRLIIDRGNAVTRLRDILDHVADARRRDEAARRLTEIRQSPGGGGGAVWGSGLSTDEIEWQISMTEKYGVSAATWPKAEVDAHQAALEAMKQKPDY